MERLGLGNGNSQFFLVVRVLLLEKLRDRRGEKGRKELVCQPLLPYCPEERKKWKEVILYAQRETIEKLRALQHANFYHIVDVW
jgi:hypothetical protein